MVVRIEATEKGEYMTVIGDNDTKLSLPAVHMDSIDIGRHIEVGLHEPSNRVQMVKVGEKTLWNYIDEEMKTQIEKEKTEKFAKMKEAYEGVKESYQEVYNQLPNIYKKRIDIRRNNGGEDFSILYEAHELHVCEMAVTLARKLGTPEEVMRYTTLSNEERHALVPEIEIPEIGDYVGASSFENVMILAYWHLAEPGVVPYIPGTPVKLGLVPAHEYGEPPYAISRAVISELAIRNPKPSLVAMVAQCDGVHGRDRRGASGFVQEGEHHRGHGLLRRLRGVRRRRERRVLGGQDRVHRREVDSDGRGTGRNAIRHGPVQQGGRLDLRCRELRCARVRGL